MFSSESEEDADNPSGPLKTILDVPPLPIDSDENSSEEEFDMEILKRDPQKSFSQFEKSVERKGLDISNINPHSTGIMRAWTPRTSWCVPMCQKVRKTKNYWKI